MRPRTVLQVLVLCLFAVNTPINTSATAIAGDDCLEGFYGTDVRQIVTTPPQSKLGVGIESFEVEDVTGDYDGIGLVLFQPADYHIGRTGYAIYWETGLGPRLVSNFVVSATLLAMHCAGSMQF